MLIKHLTVAFTIVLSVGLNACTTIANNIGNKSNDDIYIEAQYKVNKDLSLTLESGKQELSDITAWKQLVNILPDDILKKQVVELQIFSEPKGGDAFAFVDINEEDKTKWVFGLHHETAEHPESEEFITTIIHEFGHIISLEVNQVNHETVMSCDTLKIEEGCSNSDSYINDYFNTFWQDSAHDQHRRFMKNEDVSLEDKTATVSKFYDKHKGHFINEYSATDPLEDFAETFAFYVLTDKVEKPKTIKDKKINFFYKYPQLVAIRDDIRHHTSIRKKLN